VIFFSILIPNQLNQFFVLQQEEYLGIIPACVLDELNITRWRFRSGSNYGRRGIMCLFDLHILCLCDVVQVANSLLLLANLLCCITPLRFLVLTYG
jgi:hypothetical protein